MDIEEVEYASDSDRTEQHQGSSDDGRDQECEARSVKISMVGILTVYSLDYASQKRSDEEETHETGKVE